MAEKYVGEVPHKTNDLFLNEAATVINTVGGVEITTNLNPPRTRTFLPPKFSTYFTLETVGEVSLKNTVFDPSNSIKLFLDKTNPKYFSKYSSLLELVRVSLETIILKYPAAIYSKTNVLGTVGQNIINSGYYFIDETTTFSANTSFFSNPFGIYYQSNPNFTFSDDRIPALRNLSKNFNKYEVVVDGVTYPILEFTPSQTTSNDFVTIKIKGNPFDLGSSSKEFYIKPIDSEINKFYDSLDEFEEYLLNRNDNFRAIFQDTQEVDGGLFLDYNLELQFPKADNYNLDVVSSFYDIYVADLVEFAKKFDEKKGNILMRKLVPENVQSVTLEDVNAAYPTYGEINRLLIVYGRNLDDINLYIEGIRTLNAVSYSNKDSMPESLLFEFVKSLGWDIDVNPPLPNDLLRLLALNSSWVFKSKGTRNAIDFILNFLGIPQEIVDFNEYVIRAKKPVDVEKLRSYYNLINPNVDFDISTLPIDEDGYPKFYADSEIDYFQRYGELDRGLSYFYKYVNLFPEGFTGSTVTYTENIESYKVLFQQNWEMTGVNLSYDIVDSNLVHNECFTVSGETITDPFPEIFLDDCGCPLPISDKALKICSTPTIFTGCTNIILDIWYDCVSGDTAILHIKPYGGKGVVSISGATDGQIVSTGDTFAIYGTDEDGCVSDTYNITIDCPNPCLTSDLFATITYICNEDEFGQNDGTATVSVVHNGISSTGIQDGDIIEDGEVAIITVYDIFGCSLTESVIINCPEPEPIVCEPISIKMSVETTSVDLNAPCSGKVNVVYDLSPLPAGYIVDTVTLTVVGSGGDNAFVVGTPVIETFNSFSGVETIDLDFSDLCEAVPAEPVPTEIIFDVTINVTFAGGCEYEETFYDLTVNPRQLGDNVTDIILANPI
jgi:hypothetical protein